MLITPVIIAGINFKKMELTKAQYKRAYKNVSMYSKNQQETIEEFNKRYAQLRKENVLLVDMLQKVMAELRCYNWSKETEPVYNEAKNFLNSIK